MKLVNIHKPLLLVLFSALVPAMANAQEVWSLQQCLDTAWVKNQSLEMMRNERTMAGEKQKELRASLIPKIEAKADYKYFTDLPYQLMPMSVFGGPEGQFKEAQFGVPHNIDAKLLLSVPVYKPEIYGGIQTAGEAARLKELMFRKNAEEVFFEISSLYYNAQILQHQIQFIEGNLANAQALKDNINLLWTQKMATGTDLRKVELQWSQLENKKKLLTTQQERVLRGLKLLMGLPLDKDISVSPEIAEQSPYREGPKESPASTDLQIVQQQGRLLGTELSTLKRSRLPSLAFIASYGTTGYGYNEAPNEFLDFYPVGFAGVQLSYPVFNGTVTRRKINQKKLELENNRLKTDWIERQNRVQVSNAKSQKANALEVLTTYEEQVALADAIYHQTLLQQKEGIASLTEVLLADNELREAQQNYLSAMVEYLKADLELRKQTGNILIKK